MKLLTDQAQVLDDTDEDPNMPKSNTSSEMPEQVSHGLHLQVRVCQKLMPPLGFLASLSFSLGFCSAGEREKERVQCASYHRKW